MVVGRFVAAASVAVCLVLAGCSSPGADVQPSEIDGISGQQADALSDGEVTEDEYQAGFKRFEACLASQGYELIVHGESNNTIEYSLPNAAVESGADLECYELEFQQVDSIWQVAHEDTSHSAEVLRDCLVAHGITPKETLREMAEQVQEAGIEQAECAG